jgi:hypothetical protein
MEEILTTYSKLTSVSTHTCAQRHQRTHRLISESPFVFANRLFSISCTMALGGSLVFAQPVAFTLDGSALYAYSQHALPVYTSYVTKRAKVLFKSLFPRKLQLHVSEPGKFEQTQRNYPFSSYFILFGCGLCLFVVAPFWGWSAWSVRAVRAAAFSTRVGVQVCRCVVCDNDKRCCAFAGCSDHEKDLNVGGMLGWFGVFAFFCSVR